MWSLRRYTASYKAAGPPGEKIAPGITRIRGNLCNVHGRFGPCDRAGGGSAGAVLPKRPKAPKATKPKKAAAPKKTPEQRQAEQDAEQAKNRNAVGEALNGERETENGLSASGLNAMQSLRTGGEVPDAMATGLVAMGLAERGTDGRVRLSSTGRAALSAADRGDVTAVQDAVSRAGDQAVGRRDRDAKRTERQTAAEQRKRDVAARRQQAEAARDGKKKPKGGGGKGTAPKPDAKPDAAEAARETTAALPAATRISPASVDVLQRAADQGGATDPDLRRLGLIGADGFATDQGRRALSALQRGNVASYNAAVQDAQARLGREAASRQRQADVAKRRSEAEQKRQTAEQERRAREASRAAIRERESQWRRENRRQRPTRATLKVFKDASGAMRWIARSTTAYRDRDREILSIAALDADSQRMTATKQYGPLRYWHIGRPDPMNTAAPWGPGVDIGDCDFSMQIGTTRIESGTFRSAAIARRMKAQADQHELSPGFFHPTGEPAPDGVFGRIHSFERSLVPTRYARASNLFTGLTIKEHRMNPEEMARRLKVAADTLGIPVDTLAAGLAQTDKAAAQQGIAFKEETPAPPAEVTIGGVVYTVKAAMPPAEMVEAGETETADGEVEEVADLDEPVADFIGDMSRADFEGMLESVFSRAVAAMGSEIAGKMAAMDEQLKGMGYARAKEAGDVAAVTQRVTDLETQLKAARAELATLTDDSARRGRGYRPSQDAGDADADLAATLKAQTNGASTGLDAFRQNLFGQ
jgi:hypothetical protein